LKVGYIDTSAVVAEFFSHVATENVGFQFKKLGFVYSSNLLEAEFWATLKREGIEDDAIRILDPIRWIYPERPLTGEIERVLKHGYIRGADLYHLATALFMTPDPSKTCFLTLDHRQSELARAIGFRVFP